MKQLILIFILYAIPSYSQIFEEWVQRYNGPGNSSDVAQSMALDNMGNIYIAGRSTGIGSDIDYSIIKYNSNGIQQWEKRYNGPGNGWDAARSIAVDVSGNVYVTGYSDGGSSSWDYATIKYNSSGVQQWVQRYNGPIGNSIDEASSIAVDVSGNVYVSGSSYGGSCNASSGSGISE